MINRRRFLQTTSASLALSVFGAEGLELVNQKPKRVGLIGTGWYGKSDLFRLIQVAPVEVVSLCDVDKQLLAEAAQLVSQRQKSKKVPRTYGDYRDMLKEKDLDIVLIGTPGSLACPANDRRRGSRGRCLCAEADQRGCSGGRGDAGRRPETQPRGAGRHPAQEHAASHRGQEEHHRRWAAGERRTCGTVLLLPHARQRQSAGHSQCRTFWTTKCGPAPRRFGPTTVCRTSAGGARLRNTATASWETCAFTCSTPPAGCWVWVGRNGSSSAGGIYVQKDGKSNISDTQSATFEYDGLQRGLAASHLGHALRSGLSLGARSFTATKGRSRPALPNTTSSPRGTAKKSTRIASFEREQFPEDVNEKGIELHAAPATRRHMLDFLAAIEKRSRPVADIEQGHISTASCILANISMQLGRPLTYDPAKRIVVGDEAATKLLRREYRSPWKHPEPGAA